MILGGIDREAGGERTTLDDLFRRAACATRSSWRWPIRSIAKASPMASNAD